MPSLRSVMLREEIRLLKPLITKFSIQTTRSLQEMLGELGARSLGNKVVYSEAAGLDVPAAFAEPDDHIAADRRVVLYLHGGGYVAGSIKYARGFAGVLAAKAGIRVLCIAYRLAPENPFPAALEDAMAAYEYLLRTGYRPQDISLIGESAGGGLIFSLCLELKNRGMEMPARVIAISPWTDMTMGSKSYEENRRRDVSLTPEEIEGFIEAYAPDRRTDPLVSPILGDLAGLPPCRIYVGSEEILLDDSLVMAVRLREAGVRCALTVEEGLWHAYVLYGVPEANEAMEEIALFLEGEDEWGEEALV